MGNADIFLSYSREDQPVARRFAEMLQKEGFTVWWDQTLATGENYDQVTEHALREAKAVVVLWSHHSVESRWVRAEATQADRLGTLMPVMIEQCMRPIMFELKHTAELAHWKGEAKDPVWLGFVSDLRRVMVREQHEPRADTPAVTAPAAVAGTRNGRGLWVAFGVIALAAIAAGSWLWQRSAAAHRARSELIPEISRRVDQGDNAGAFALAQQARSAAPDDPLLKSLTPLFVAKYAVTTTPEGVDVYVRRYDGAESDWQHLGRTPLKVVELPRAALRWRFEKQGFATAERANSALAFQDANSVVERLRTAELHVDLQPSSEQPADMVYVPAGPAVPSGDVQPVATVPAFYMQRTEVTNAQYKEFIDAGGYERQSFWTELEQQQGASKIAFAAAMKQFEDPTGHPGPATWELGSFPDGQGDYPVTGVSWYEAAAYARFRGRSLPTYFHWLRAALPQDELPSSLAASVAPRSNLGTGKPAQVGKFEGVGLYGTYDLFGNAREWLFNPGKGVSWLMGGSWEDPAYQFALVAAASPMDRSKVNGFRTMQVSGESREMASLWAQLDLRLNKADASSYKPVSDAVYADYERQLAYEPGPLNATAPEILATTEDWVKERVTIDTGYNHERMAVVIFRPKRAVGPFEPVLFISGGLIVWFPDRSENIEPGFLGMPLDYIVKSGRMLVQPVLQGTFERFKSAYDPKDRARTLTEWIQRRQDLGRTLDYLATRSDTAMDKVGFIGLSFGASAALPLVAVEHRLKAAVLVSGGMPPPGGPLSTDVPLMDVPSHATRIRIPVLMINGRFDNTFPLETAVEPIFRLFGTPAANKDLKVLPYGHGSPPRADMIRLTSDWYDKYLGPVQ